MRKVIEPEFSAKRIKLEGAFNVRDVGGYATCDGRFTRPGILFRADSLHALTHTDKRKIDELGIRTVIDLRHPKEVERYPNLLAQLKNINYLNIPFYRGWRDLFPDGERPQSLADLYTTILDNCHESIWEILTVLADPDNYPLMVHCQAGKDRTGMLVALLLWVADVPQEVIIADYALSNGYLQPVLNKFREDAKELGYDLEFFEQVLKSPPEAMRQTLVHLHQKYGSVTDFLRIVGLDDFQLKTLHRILVFP